MMNRDLWITDLARNASTRLTSDPSDESFPVSSPDGRRIAFSADRGGVSDLYVKPASGVGAEQPLFRSAESKRANDWSRDGRFFLYSTSDQKTGSDIWVLPLDGHLKPTRLIGTESFETLAQFSPDARWIAYKSDESGTPEIYVQPFPLSPSTGRSGGKWTISQGGGHQPRWRPDGKELFYLTGDGMLTAVDVDGAGQEFNPGVPRPLFRAQILGAGPTIELWRWDVAPDGQRFLMITPPAESPSPITVVLNWQAGLKKK
jgi:Tol biopolymer transport system component